MIINIVTQDELAAFENKLQSHFEELKRLILLSHSTLFDVEIDTKEAAKQLGCSVATISNMLERGELRSVSNTTSHRFKFADVLVQKRKAS